MILLYCSLVFTELWPKSYVIDRQWCPKIQKFFVLLALNKYILQLLNNRHFLKKKKLLSSFLSLACFIRQFLKLFETKNLYNLSSSILFSGLRFLRALRLMSIPDILTYLNILNSNTVLRLSYLVSVFLSLWLSAGGFLHLVSLEHTLKKLKHNLYCDVLPCKA